MATFTKDSIMLLQSCNSVCQGHPTSGYLLKRSSKTGFFNKRWFLLHDHFLVYFRTEPTSNNAVVPCASLDLHRVLYSTLHKDTITLQLFAHATNALLSKLSRSTTTRFVLKASHASNAQLWLDNIRRIHCVRQIPIPLPPSSSDISVISDDGKVRVKRLKFKFDSSEIVLGEEECALLQQQLKEECEYIATTMRNANRVVIVLENGKILSQTAQDNYMVKFDCGNMKQVIVEWKLRENISITSALLSALPVFMSSSCIVWWFANPLVAALFAIAILLYLNTITRKRRLVVTKLECS